MDWSKLKKWEEFLLKNQHKDNIINITIGEFRRVLPDPYPQEDNAFTSKNKIPKNKWESYGRLNCLFEKINRKFNCNLELPRDVCKSNKNQKFKKMDDIIIGKMYNIPAEMNGIDTQDSNYFYVPICKTRRHIHGVPKEFLYDYLINMIDNSIWEKTYYSYYSDSRFLYACSKFMCPEKHTILNYVKDNENLNNLKEIQVNCNKALSPYKVIYNCSKYLSNDDFEKIKKHFHKKRVHNFVYNFPNKSRFVTYCVGNCINSVGYIHNGIPSGKQRCNTCSITYCRECGALPYHDKELCKVNFEELEIKFDNPENYRKCPGCGIWVEKQEGCDHMQCYCGVHFCYNCRGVLSADDPYFHRCTFGEIDPHYRDFPLNHIAAYPGEIACKCLSCC